MARPVTGCARAGTDNHRSRSFCRGGLGATNLARPLASVVMRPLSRDDEWRKLLRRRGLCARIRAPSLSKIADDGQTGASP